MATYRKKPVEVNAFRLGIDNWPDWAWDRVTRNDVTLHDLDRFKRTGHVVIYTLEGEMRADFGDWIIKGVADELYPCKPDIFEQTYEPVEAQP